MAGTAAATFALAGCSDSTSSPSRAITPDAADLTQSFDVVDATGRHVFRTKQWFENDARNNARPSKVGGGTGISYHGGPVLQAGTKVAAI
jgi:hypothetical protein